MSGSSSNRITWQNVQGPRTGGAAAAIKVAGDLVGSGFQSIGDGLISMDDRRKDVRSNEAMARAMQYTDTNQWEQMMNNGGMAKLGFDPSMMNAEAMEFFGNNRSELLADDSTIASTALTGAQTQGRNILNKQNAYDYDRTQIMDDRTDAATALKIKADNWAQSAGKDAWKPAEVEKLILDLDLNAAEEAAYRKAVAERGDVDYVVDESVKTDVAGLSEWQNIADYEANQANDLDRIVANNPEVTLFAEGQKAFGGSAFPGKDMLTNVAKFRGDLEEDAWRTSSGKAHQVYEDMVNTYGDKVDKGTIAYVVQSMVTSGDWLKLQSRKGVHVDTASIEKELGKLARDGAKDGNQAIRNEIRRIGEKNTAFSSKASKLRSDYEIVVTKARSSPTPRNVAEVERLENEIRKLNSLAIGDIPITRNNPNPTNTKNDPKTVSPETELISDMGSAGKVYRMSDGTLAYSGSGMATTNQAKIQQIMSNWANKNNNILSEADVTPTPTPNPNVDPRIAKSSREIKQGLANFGQGVDNLLGDAAAVTGRTGAGIWSGLGHGVGLFAPELGSSMLDQADRYGKIMDKLAAEGYVPGVSRGEQPRLDEFNRNNPGNIQPTASFTPAGELASSGPEQPMNAVMDNIIASGKLPEAQVKLVRAMQASLDAGKNLQTGLPLQLEERATIQQTLARIVQNYSQ